MTATGVGHVMHGPKPQKGAAASPKKSRGDTPRDGTSPPYPSSQEAWAPLFCTRHLPRIFNVAPWRRRRIGVEAVLSLPRQSAPLLK